MLKQITPHQVRRGMYVHGFGGSWIHHPFWRSRFLLETDDDVERIRHSGVPHVVIDESRGVLLNTDRGRPGPVSVAPSYTVEPARRVTAPVHSLPRATEQDWERNRQETDRQAALALVKQARKVMRSVFQRARHGEAPNMEQVAPVVIEIAHSVSRNAEALLSVIRLKSKNEYTYFHSIAVCTLMIHLARHLDLDDAQVRDLGMAGLLHDIGKMGIEDDILNKPGRLTETEWEAVRAHPEFGSKLLLDVEGVPPEAIDVCLHHHEKLDGTGYPYGKASDDISLAARLGAICDVYDALTSDRPYKTGWAAADALGAMWNWEGHFDRTLLFGLMQCLNIFPAGLLVRLRSNRLGIVLENGRRTTRPTAFAFYSARENCLITPESVTIAEDFSGDQIISIERPELWGFLDWEALSTRLLRREDLRDAA